jgi:antitoxin component of MazEF toxin-antitoxin module
MTEHVTETSINQWGNGLAVRINKAIAKAAGVAEGTHVRIIAQPGRIIVETVEKAPTLTEMLAAFDPQRHCGEVMAFEPIGLELT